MTKFKVDYNMSVENGLVPTKVYGQDVDIGDEVWTYDPDGAVGMPATVSKIKVKANGLVFALLDCHWDEKEYFDHTEM